MMAYSITLFLFLKFLQNEKKWAQFLFHLPEFFFKTWELVWAFFDWPELPQDHAVNLRQVESSHCPLFNQNHWGHRQNLLFDYFWAAPGRRWFSVSFSATQHVGSWESSATMPYTLQDDGQAVIIGKLFLFLKDREERERMGQRTARGCAMKDVFLRKHLLHSRYHFFSPVIRIMQK